MLINASNINSMYTGFKILFGKGFETTESYAQRLASMLPSNSREENYAWIGQIPAMREWIGDRQIGNLEAFSYLIKNRTFELTVEIPREDIEDDKLGTYGEMFKQLGSQSKIHPDELLFGLLKNGFGAACYDGQYFFDTDHPVTQADGTASSVSNMAAGTDPAWFLIDATKMIKPLIFQTRRDYKLTSMNKESDEHVFMRNKFLYGVDARVNAGYGLWQLAYGSKLPLTAENYASARAAMRSLKANNGKPMHVSPNVLVVPPSLEDAALKLLKANQLDSGASNIYANTAELIVSSWLD